MKIIHALTLVKKSTDKYLKFKMVIMLEYHNAEIFLEMAILQIGLRKFL